MALAPVYGNPQAGDKVTWNQIFKLVSHGLFDAGVAAGYLTQAKTLEALEADLQTAKEKDDLDECIRISDEIKELTKNKVASGLETLRVKDEVSKVPVRWLRINR